MKCASFQEEVERVFTHAEINTEVHGDRHLRLGVRRTFLKAKKTYLGDKLRYDYIEGMVSRCARCQMNRLRMVGYMEPVVRHLKVLNLTQ